MLEIMARNGMDTVTLSEMFMDRLIFVTSLY